mgnify:CR=1 FL=1
MTMLWLLLALMLFGLAAVLLMLTREDGIAPEAEKRFNEVLETPEDVSWMTQRRWRRTNSLSDRFRRMLERIPGTDMQEIELLMRQAGIVDDRTRALAETLVCHHSLLYSRQAIGFFEILRGEQHGGAVVHEVFA